MNRTVTVLSVLALATVAASCARCGKAEDKPVAGKPGAADISTLPGFLHYPGVMAVGRVQHSTADSKGTEWTLLSGDSMPVVVEWYRASLGNLGWNKNEEMEAAWSILLGWEKPDKKETVRLLIYQQDDTTRISLAHGLK